MASPTVVYEIRGADGRAATHVVWLTKETAEAVAAAIHPDNVTVVALPVQDPTA